MAQTIYCDLEGCQTEDGSPTPAVWLVTNIGSGDANAWCTPHYLELSRALLAAAAPEPEPAPAPGPDQPDADDEDQDDAEALRRLEATGPARPAEEGAAVSDDAGAPSEAPGPAGEAVEALVSDYPLGPEGGPAQGAPAAEAIVSDYPLGPEGGPAQGTPAAEGPKVVRRGTSKSRRQHEARKRAKKAATAEPKSTG